MEYKYIRVLERNPKGLPVEEFFIIEGNKVAREFGLSPVLIVTSLQDYAELSHNIGAKIVQLELTEYKAVQLGDIHVTADRHVNYPKTYIPLVPWPRDLGLKVSFGT